MNRTKRIISALLSITMMFLLATPVFATEMPITPAISTEDITTANDNFTNIDTIGNAAYYVQKTTDYTVAIGLYSNFADCSIKYHDTNTIRSAVVPIEDISSFLPQARSSNQTVQFEAIKGAILNGSFRLEEVTFQTSDIPFSPTTRVTSGEKEKIMTELYNGGVAKSIYKLSQSVKNAGGCHCKSLSYFEL